MLDTGVIFVDGLPGTGKTTLSGWLSQRLAAEGIETRMLPERAIPHPLRWFKHYDGREYLPPDFENISLATHVGSSVEKWVGFSDSIGSSKEVLIIDGYPFLNTVGIFVWGDADEELIRDYMEQVHGCMEETEASTIFLDAQDVVSALDRKLGFLQRDNLVEEFLLNMNRLPFLRNRGLSGPEGTLVMWEKINQSMTRYYLGPLYHGLVIDRDAHDATAVQLRAETYLGIAR